MKNKFLIFLIVLIILLFVGLKLFTFFKDTSDLSESLTPQVVTLSQHLTSEEYDSAYSMMSSAFQDEYPLEKFKEQFSSKAVVALFNNITMAEPTKWNYQKATGGVDVLIINGTVTYTDGDKGEFQAKFVKDFDNWKFNGIFINANPKRIDQTDNSASEVLGVSI